MSREKIGTHEEISKQIRLLQEKGRKVVFTNGCFDLLHPGHVRYLQAARALGDALIVALNSDGSVRRLKGPDRPILSSDSRCEIMAALACVDFVTTFSEDTPLQVIEKFKPDVLVKGGDWAKEEIVGRASVESRGGAVHTISFEQGFSTSTIIQRIRRAGGPLDPRRR